MRSRVLKPGFFRNEELCALTPWHRLLFAGLWLLSDRNGYLENRPKRIRADLFPYDDLDVPTLLHDLQAAGFIQLYRTASGSMIHLPTFTKHQHCHPREAAAELPDLLHAVPSPEQVVPRQDLNPARQDLNPAGPEQVVPRPEQVVPSQNGGRSDHEPHESINVSVSPIKALPRQDLNPARQDLNRAGPETVMPGPIQATPRRSVSTSTSTSQDKRGGASSGSGGNQYRPPPLISGDHGSGNGRSATTTTGEPGPPRMFFRGNGYALFGWASSKIDSILGAYQSQFDVQKFCQQLDARTPAAKVPQDVWPWFEQQLRDEVQRLTIIQTAEDEDRLRKARRHGKRFR